jgi:hypothetical protein
VKSEFTNIIAFHAPGVHNLLPGGINGLEVIEPAKIVDQRFGLNQLFFLSVP